VGCAAASRRPHVVVGAGTVPARVDLSGHPFPEHRYEYLVAEYAEVGRQQLVCAMQTQVGVDDREAAVAALPAVQAWLPVLLVGIEAHICVTQTTLDLLARGHAVYVLADGVSSCNREEVPVALARLRAEGAVVTTSESWLYECMGDASIEEFRAMSALVKETKEQTKDALSALCKI